jgi:hypothetical protein
MSLEPKSLNRFSDTPRDKPVSERTEHANLERPGAQSHPRARGWNVPAEPVMAWRHR